MLGGGGVGGVNGPKSQDVRVSRNLAVVCFVVLFDVNLEITFPKNGRGKVSLVALGAFKRNSR